MTTTNTRHRYAVIFPGQGSQSVGMLADWYETYPQVVQIFNQASEAVGFDLWAVCQGTHPTLSLDDTAYTQPALLTASMAIWQVLRDELAIEPAYLAGHSLGEYSALCAAGVINLADAVRLVHHRGLYMTQALQPILATDPNSSLAPVGKMAAVLGLDDEQVKLLCEQVQEHHAEAIVSAANFNAEGQVVIAGNELGVDLAIAQVTSLGKKAVLLKVSVPSHCQLMQPASEQLRRDFEAINFNPPQLRVLHNRHANIEESIEGIKQALIEQLSEPVLWSTIQRKLADKHMEFQIECGSGNVLTNLAKRQTQKIPTVATDKVGKLEEIRALLQGDGQ